MEASNSTQEQPETSQLESLKDPPEQLETQPVLPDPSEQPQGAPALEQQTSQPFSEQGVQAQDQSEADAGESDQEPQQEAKEEPATFEQYEAHEKWESLDDVDLESVPAETRPMIEKLVTLATAKQEQAQAELAQSKQIYDERVEAFNKLMEDLDQGKDAGKIIEQHQKAVEAAADNEVKMAASMFSRLYDVDAIPDDTMEQFDALLRSPQFDLFEGNLLEKMEAGLKFAAYQTGGKNAEDWLHGRSTTRGPESLTKPDGNESEDAAKQAALAGRTRGPAISKPSVEEEDWDTVLGRYDHLLDGL